MAAMQEVERSGSRFYKVGGNCTVIYDRIDRTTTSIRRDRPDLALRVISECAKIDPSNPLFDCLRAAALWQAGDKPGAVNAATAGRSKGTLRLYGSARVEPITWQWPEVEIISHTAREMSDDNPNDQRQLLAALSMADKLVWSEPAHPIRIMLGFSARQSVAKRLKSLAIREGNAELQRLCDKLIQEGKAFRDEWSKSLAISERSSATRASSWAFQRALRDRSQHREAAAILELDEQANWAERCRAKNIVPGLAEEAIIQAEKRNGKHAGR